jgi:hypothetical protein
MPVLKHVHQYQRAKNGNHPIMRCMTVGCSHFLPNVEMALNRESLCCSCKANKLVITQSDLTKQRIKFFCPYCKEALNKQRRSLAGVAEKYALDGNGRVEDEFFSDILQGDLDD